MPSLIAAAAEAEASPWAMLALLLFVGASLMVWASLVQRLVQREPIIPFAPRRQVPWNWLFLLIAAVIYLGATIAAVMLTHAVTGVKLTAATPHNAQNMILLLVSTSAAGLFSTLLTLLVLAIWSGATKSDLGLDTRWLGSDLLYGIAGFLAVTPVVFFIKWLLLPLSDEKHPLEELAREHPTPAVLFGTVMVAVVIAPWVEEFLLRVVFQGWLERCFWGGWTPLESNPPSTEELPNELPLSDSGSTNGDGPLNPFAPPSVEPLLALPESRAQEPPTPLHAAMPIAISSAVFAALHIGHGVDPIPLFVLALVLGWLYQRTHRLWPSVALHTALNATSVVMLFLST